MTDPDPTPRTVPWARVLDRVRWIGPGIVMAGTAIGASHLVLAPTAGAAYGFGLLWLITFSHFFKYPAFDFGPRYAVARGASLLDGYARIPGPRGWALWAFLAGTVAQGLSVLAAVLGVSAAVAHAAFPGISIALWSALLGVVSAGLLWSGRFDGLSALSKWMLAGLVIMTLMAFLSTPPPPGVWIDLVRPSLPAGSIVLAAALFGFMPTGLDVSVWHSMWSLERRPAWIERAGGTGAPPRRVLAVGLLDLRIGYALTAVLALMFLSLGVAVLRPSGSIPSGADVAITLARLYTDVLGTWSLGPFLLAAFFGMFTSAYGVMDGFPRAFAGTITRIFDPSPISGERWYWGFLGITLALAVAEIAWLGSNPVQLVTIAAVTSFLLAPLTFACNYWCVTRDIPDAGLRPGRALRAWAITGIACTLAATVVFLFVRFTQ